MAQNKTHVSTFRNGDKLYRDSNGKIIGSYDKSANTFRDSKGKRI